MLIPIYTKGNSDDPRKKTEQEVPKRPGGLRSEPVPNENFRGNGFNFGGGIGGVHTNFVLGFGLIPTLLSLAFSASSYFTNNNRRAAAGMGGAQNP